MLTVKETDRVVFILDDGDIVAELTARNAKEVVRNRGMGRLFAESPSMLAAIRQSLSQCTCEESSCDRCEPLHHAVRNLD